MSLEVVDKIEAFMAARDDQDYQGRDRDGRPLVLRRDGDTLVVELGGTCAPVLALSDAAQQEVAEATGAAFGMVEPARPGFPGARLIGEARPGDQPENPYCDPAHNEMIRFGE